MKVAIDTIISISHEGKSVLVLGDMFELGERSDKMHSEILKYALSKNPDEIHLIGRAMGYALDRCKHPGCKHIRFYKNHEAVAEELAGTLKPGDILLLKGSRGMQMERVLAHL